MSTRETAKTLAERWRGKDIRNGHTPFGKTAAGLADYRGWTPSEAFSPGSVISSADFARATFELIKLRKVTFERCSFEAATFRGVDHLDCVFRECSFARTVFRRCGWGGGPNVYDGCRFEKCTLASSSTVEMQFLNSRFDGNKFHAIFTGAVFQNCRFSGKLESCNFIGEAQHLRIRKTGGFYGVDLSGASFEMVAFLKGFQFQNVTPPADGHNLLLPKSQYADLIVRLTGSDAAHSDEAQIAILALDLREDGYTICSRYDLAFFFGEEAAQTYFDQIREAVTG